MEKCEEVEHKELDDVYKVLERRWVRTTTTEGVRLPQARDDLPCDHLRSEGFLGCERERFR